MHGSTAGARGRRWRRCRQLRSCLRQPTPCSRARCRSRKRQRLFLRPHTNASSWRLPERELGPGEGCGAQARLAAIDPEHLHDCQVEAQRFRTWRTDLGNVAFQGEFPPEVGVPFIQRLDAETDRLWRAAVSTSELDRGSGMRRAPSRGWSRRKGRGKGRRGRPRDRVRHQRVPAWSRRAGRALPHRRRRADSRLIGA